MMNYVNGWMDGGMMSGNNWVILVIGILVVVVAVVLIGKVSRNSAQSEAVHTTSTIEGTGLMQEIRWAT